MNNELMVKESGYLKVKNFDINEGLNEIQGTDLPLDKIKIPTGGGLAFGFTNENGDPDEIKEIEGVIIFSHVANVYYKDKYTGGNNPPDCGSYDGETGEGNPGGLCSKCTHNKFGSGDGNGKACKEKRRLFILFEGNYLPAILTIPTGSMKEFNLFLSRLLTKGRFASKIVTKFVLKQATSSTGITYSQVKLSKKRDLTQEEINVLKPLTEHIKSFSKNIALDADSNDEERSEVVAEVKPLI